MNFSLMNRLTLGFMAPLLITVQSSALDWWSVSEKDTQNAACMDLKPTSEKTMLEYLEAKTTDPDLRANATIRGVHFQDEIPELIEIFSGIHQPSILARDPKDLDAAGCDKVMCAMEKLYGKKTGLRMLYIYAKFGLTTSPQADFQPDNYQNWKASELDDILIALESLPPTVLPIKDRHLLHFLEGYSLKSYGEDRDLVLANARMDIFDGWNKKSKMERISVILHEFGHVLGSKLDDTAEWKSMPRKFISQYAKTNDAEDFAESFLAYRFAPNKLKKTSAERYNFIKEKLFNGLEFKKTRDCEEPFREAKNTVQQNLTQKREIVSWIVENKTEIANQVKRQEEIGYFKERAWAACGASYLNELAKITTRTDTDACIQRVIKKRSAIVEARKHEKEDLKENQIPSSQLQEIQVSKRKIQYIRQELHEKATDFLEKIYQDEFRFVDNQERCNERIDFLTRYKKESPLHLAPQAITKALTKACDQMEKGGVLRQFFGPSFEDILRAR